MPYQQSAHSSSAQSSLAVIKQRMPEGGADELKGRIDRCACVWVEGSGLDGHMVFYVGGGKL